MHCPIDRYLFSDNSGFAHRLRFPSAKLGGDRTVDIWCPTVVDGSSRRLPVIYMHDGQNIFDPALSFTGVDWGVDEAISRLTREGLIAGAIVVGIWNSPQRKREYMPKKPFEGGLDPNLVQRFLAEHGGAPVSDNYLEFIVVELKPYIDEHFPTAPERPHTFIMGSSMGGLASLDALERYPDVFGGAACLSTHWVIGATGLVDALGRDLPSPEQHRLYFDHGTEALDQHYGPLQQRMQIHLLRRRLRRGPKSPDLHLAGARPFRTGVA